MKLKVLKEFREASDFSVLHAVGDVIEVSDERGAYLLSLGLVSVAEEAPKPKKHRSRRSTEAEEAPKPKKSSRKVKVCECTEEEQDNAEVAD